MHDCSVVTSFSALPTAGTKASAEKKFHVVGARSAATDVTLKAPHVRALVSFSVHRRVERGCTKKVRLPPDAVMSRQLPPGRR
jgi:hypothetical protein